MQLPGGMDLAGFNNFLATGTQTTQSGIWRNSKRDSTVWSFNTKYEKEIGDWTFKPRVYANWWKHYHPVTGLINDTVDWTQTIGTDIEGQLKHSLGGMPASLVAGVTLRQVGNSDSRQYQYRDVTRMRRGPAASLRLCRTSRGRLPIRKATRTPSRESSCRNRCVRLTAGWSTRACVSTSPRFSMTTNEISRFDYATSKYVAGAGLFQTNKSYNLPSYKLGATFKAMETVKSYVSVARSSQLPSNAEITANPNSDAGDLDQLRSRHESQSR